MSSFFPSSMSPSWAKLPPFFSWATCPCSLLDPQRPLWAPDNHSPHRNQGDFYKTPICTMLLMQRSLQWLTKIPLIISSLLAMNLDCLKEVAPAHFSTSSACTSRWPLAHRSVSSFSNRPHPLLPQGLPTSHSRRPECFPAFFMSLALSHPSSLSIFTFSFSIHLEFILTFSHDYLLCFF